MTRPGYITVEQLRAMEAGKGKPTRAEKKESGHDYKTDFLNQLHFAQIPAPVQEHVFHPKRKWRLDFAWIDQKVMVEYQGIMGAKTASHGSMTGQMRDHEKTTEASLLGWTVILINAKTVQNGKALQWVERALKGK